VAAAAMRAALQRLAMPGEIGQETGMPTRVFHRMRARMGAPAMLVFSAATLCACIDHDPVRVQSFLPGPGSSFTYSVRTNTMLSANDDGGAEAIRRRWLAQTLGAQGMCNRGYVIYQRQLVVPPERSALVAQPFTPANPDSAADFGNTGYVVYTGACL
jgi:hypothetical protein